MLSKLAAKKTKIAGIEIYLTQKKIKNLHLRLCLISGEIKVSAPLYYNFAQIEKFIIQKIPWIKKTQEKITKLRNEGKILLPKKFITGEEHYFFGEKFRLELSQNCPKNKVIFEDNLIKIQMKKLSNFKQRQKLIDDFYRLHLKKIIPTLIKKYEVKMSVEVKEFGIKKMKTRLGTCNPKARRIWLNLELAKEPIEYLEKIIVHEMVHFFESKHNKNFYALVDKFIAVP